MIKCIEYKQVKVRKPTTCFGCGRQFPVGTIMEAQTMRDKDLYHIHLCLACESLVNDLVEDGGIYYEGDFREMAPTYERTIN